MNRTITRSDHLFLTVFLHKASQASSSKDINKSHPMVIQFFVANKSLPESSTVCTTTPPPTQPIVPTLIHLHRLNLSEDAHRARLDADEANGFNNFKFGLPAIHPISPLNILSGQTLPDIDRMALRWYPIWTAQKMLLRLLDPPQQSISGATASVVQPVVSVQSPVLPQTRIPGSRLHPMFKNLLSQFPFRTSHPNCHISLAALALFLPKPRPPHQPCLLQQPLPRPHHRSRPHLLPHRLPPLPLQ